MKAEERRKEIVRFMMSEQEPISGGQLSKQFGVSRQIIVRDISILKASGYEILSTHNGYQIHGAPLIEKVFKFFHTKEQTEDELNTVVDFGGTVADVFVWHKVYGKVAAKLNISSRYHVLKFLEGVRTGKSIELMNITGGYHYHTIRTDSEESMVKIEKALQKKNYILKDA